MTTDTALRLAMWIPICPLVAFFLIVFLGRKLPGHGSYIALASMVAAFILMIAVNLGWLSRLATGNSTPWQATYTWIRLGPVNHWAGVSLAGGYMMDSAAAVLLFVVTTVGTLIFWFASGYMEGDPGYARFFAYLCLFASSMLGVVLANSLLWFFMCWEIMGLCSYFLIGFWYNKPSAMKAAKKAFVVTRVGDVGFFTAIIALYMTTREHTLTFSQILAPAQLHHLWALSWHLLGWTVPAGAIIALLIFCGAIGKSAQFPLHVWLPDAMEGPTPVSALIHAATMVAAGVYLVARMYPLFTEPALSGQPGLPLMVVAGIGAFTAIFAATMAVPHTDIKKVLAYSTISQLGYMFMSLGCFGYMAALFHLMTHAFFKALLFLGAGSVHHSVDTYDMREMGGLKRKMPITRATYMVGCLALAGIPPLAGFWSKDAILNQAFRCDGAYYKIIFWIGILAALLTAFYTFRMYIMVFEGTPRNAKRQAHAHESPPVLIIPLCLLAVGAALIGLVGIPFGNADLFARLVHYNIPALVEREKTTLTIGLIILSTAVALTGAYLSVRAYLYHRSRTPEEGGLLGTGLQPVYNAASNLWYVDEFYQRSLVLPTLSFSNLISRIDDKLVDGILVNGSAWLTLQLSYISDWIDTVIVDGLVREIVTTVGKIGDALRSVQQGVIQVYALLVFISLFLLVVIMQYIR